MRIELEMAEIKELTGQVAELTAQVGRMAAEMAALKALLSKAPGAAAAQVQENQGPRVVDIKAAAALAGISEATLRRRLAANDFPAKIKLSTGRVGWVAAEVIAWVEARKVAA